MKSRLNFIKTLAATVFGTAFIGTKSANAATSETTSENSKIEELAKKIDKIEAEEVTVGQDGMIGEVRLFAGNFPPRTWAFCEGQLLAISQNQALFSILGTTYGGDGRTTFALPDLRGRSAISPGTGPGLSSINLGARGGAEYFTPILNNTVRGTAAGPGRSGNVNLNDNSIRQVSTNLRDPYLGVYYIICLQGVFPSRS